MFAGSVDTSVESLKRIFTTTTIEQCVMVGSFCWGLWSKRNKWVWEKINMSVSEVKNINLNMLTDWSRAQEIKGQNSDEVRTNREAWCRSLD